MKDDEQDISTPAGLPPCPKSSQCLSFIDELSGGKAALNVAQENAQDQELMTQLREHLPTCPTCTATVASANKVIAEQRRALRALLDEGTRTVPSTTSRIMAAIRQEQQTTAKEPESASNHVTPVTPIVPFLQRREIETPLPVTPRRRFRSGPAALVAVAVILIASFSVLSYLLVPHSSSTNGSGNRSSTKAVFTATTAGTAAPTVTVTSGAASLTPPVTTSTWSTFIMTYRINGTTIIANYDPVAGKSATITTSPYAVTSVSGVSHMGDKVLYSIYDGFKTSYYIYPQSTTSAFYTTPDKNSSAVWSTDDSLIFINTSKGVAQINVQTHAMSMILPAIASTTLNDYRDGFLYFIKSSSGQTYATQGILQRANVTTGDVQQLTSSCQNGANFWLSPGGITVYYTCLDSQNTSIYSVGSDGSNVRVFRYDEGNVIGYAGTNGAPLTLKNVNGKYQIVQLDLNSSNKDAVLLNDVAPGASTVTASSVAVAPYGQVLIAKGIYGTDAATASERLWYNDLVTGIPQQLNVPRGARSLNTIGWDKLQVS